MAFAVLTTSILARPTHADVNQPAKWYSTTQGVWGFGGLGFLAVLLGTCHSLAPAQAIAVMDMKERRGTSHS